MKDIPIIFSAPMVLALLSNRKTQTRRLAWGACRYCKDAPMKGEPHKCPTCGGRKETASPWQRVKPGDRLWVRENWSHDALDLETCRTAFEDMLPGGNSYGPYYFVGEVSPRTLRWRPSIHMPRWASRLTLTVTSTKVERLQDISDADAIAEGIVEDNGSGPDIFYLPGSHLISGVNAPKGKLHIGQHPSARLVYRDLVNNLHGGDLWAGNPEVVALSFTVHKTNIDAMVAKAA